MHMHTGLAGHFRIEVRDGATEELKRSYDFDNLILDTGLEFIGTNVTSYKLNYCQVGSNNTVPAESQTGLIAHIAGVAVTQEINPPTPVAPDYVMRIGYRYRFGIGVATGNLSEVGVGWGASGATLFSRALITDGGGTPTTISILATELLDVYYYLDIYPRVTDYVHVVNIGGADITCTSRWAEALTWVGGASQWSGYLGAVPNYGSARYTSSGIAAITGQPSGIANFRNFSLGSYLPGSHYIDLTAVLEPGAGTGTIRTVELYCPKFAVTQVEFSPPLSKSAFQTLTLVYRVSWGRYVP